MTEQRATTGGVPLLDALAALRSLGLDTRVLTRNARIEEKKLTEPSVRLEAETFVRLFDLAEELSGDPNIGLHAGERAVLRDLLAHLALSSTRVEDGLRHVCRFHGFVIDTVRIQLHEDADTLFVAVDATQPSPKISHLVLEYVLILLARLLTSTVGSTVTVEQVHLCNRDGSRATEIGRLFGCPARLGQARHALVLSRTALRAHNRPVNPLIGEQIEKFAGALLSPMPQPLSTTSEPLAERIGAAIRTLLIAGCRADRGAVSRRLRMSEPAFVRAMEEAELSFTDVRDAVMMEVAQALLLNETLKMESVALCLGFGNAAAFSKTFRRRLGQAPSQYRQQACLGLLQ